MKEGKGIEMVRIVIFSCLFLGFYLFFYQGQILEWLCIILKRTQVDVDLAARQRRLENKRQLLELQKHHTLWFGLERCLYYSGIRQRFPSISTSVWMFGNLTGMGLIFLIVTFFWGIRTTVIIIAIFMVAESILLRYLRLRNLCAVSEDLIKLLNFLKNYSITAAEVTGVFNQISRYMEEPLRTVLEECYLKAQVTGNVGTALLSMEEKIEHPKFKELARNIEISTRYCADFTALVSCSRRSMREYLWIVQERKTMLREAVVNLLLLIAMSLAVLLAVAYLSNLSLREMSLSLWGLIWGNIVGRVSLAALGVIFLLFWVQSERIYK